MPISEVRYTVTADIRRIVQGENLTINAEVFDEVTKQAMNLQGLTAGAAVFIGTPTPPPECLPQQVTVELGAGLELGEGPGRLAIELTGPETTALKLGTDMPYQLLLTLADGSTRILQVTEQLDVVAQLF